MGKRIIVQARGKGSHTYRVKRKAFSIKPKYPREISGEGKIIKLINSAGHSAPLAKIKYAKGTFFIPAFRGAFEGQKIALNGNTVAEGNILKLKEIPIQTSVYDIEARPGDGGVFIKTGGSSGIIKRTTDKSVFITMPSKKEKEFHINCRAIIGTVAGSGRLDKPIIKAGKRHHIKRAKGKLWPRTSAVKMNVIDHPFGSGRGKNPKSKIPKRNAPPGKKVGLLRARKTGKRK